MSRLILGVVLVGISCVTTKSLMWSGWHVDVATTEPPREEFQVGEYVVVAYSPGEDNEDVAFLYEFAIAKAGKQVGLAHLQKFGGGGYLLCYEYFDEDLECITRKKSVYLTQYKSFVTMEMYRDRPPYEELKYAVITALAGTETLTHAMITAEGDSIKVVLKADGTWLPWYFSAEGKGPLDLVRPYNGGIDAALKLPRFVTAGTLELQLRDDGTWALVSPETLFSENISDSILYTGTESPPVEVVQFSAAEVKPKVVDAPRAIYPEQAREAGIEGSVVTCALIDVDGTISSAEIIKSSGNALLDLESLRCVMKAKFTPAMQWGRAVRAWVSRPIEFRLR